MVWLVAAFVFCPCHLPLTLALLTAIFAGTGFAAARPGNVIGGVVITAAWALGTWRGVWLLRSANRARSTCDGC